MMSKAAGFLWPTEATKEDASWVCNARDGTVIAAVLRGATRPVQVPYWGGGKGSRIRIPVRNFRRPVMGAFCRRGETRRFAALEASRLFRKLRRKMRSGKKRPRACEPIRKSGDET